MLTPYRRHLRRCPHRLEGQHFTLCECPVWAYGSDHRGEPVRRSLQTSDWARALERISNWGLAPSPAALEATAPRIKLSKAVDAFLADARARNLKLNTILGYERTLFRLREALPVNVRVPSVDVSALDRFRRSRQIAPRSSATELQILRTFFGWCHEREWVERNPARQLRMPRVDDVATLPFTAEEIEKLIAATDRIFSTNARETPYIRARARAMVYALLYSGLRISDVSLLRRAALDESTRHLTLRITKTGVPLKVQLHPDAVQALVTLPAQNPEYFFWTGRGAPDRCAKNMWRTIKRLGALAGVENAHPHRFRDTFAVDLLTHGADIWTVQELLGHESVKTTQKHYAHFVVAHQARLDAATATLDFEPKTRRPVLMHPLQNRSGNA